MEKLQLKDLTLEDACNLKKGNLIYINPEPILLAPLGAEMRKGLGQKLNPDEQLKFEAFKKFRPYFLRVLEIDDSELFDFIRQYIGVPNVKDVWDTLIFGRKEILSVDFDYNWMLEARVISIQYNTEPVEHIGIHIRELEGPKNGFYYRVFKKLVFNEKSNKPQLEEKKKKYLNP